MGGRKKKGLLLLFLAEIGCYGEGRLTDFLVGVGKPQLIVSGSSALEAS
jgi:hypothetical protein